MGKLEFPGLNWTKVSSSGEYREAVLGTTTDGAYFTLMHMPTCYRRGPYRLMISILCGPRHYAWGCFDADDQPMRWYHSEANALDEANAIARVLWHDRHRIEHMGQAIDPSAMTEGAYRTDTKLP